MGEARRRKFYRAALEYAKQYDLPVKVALRRMIIQHYENVLYRRATKCPRCGKHDLRIDSAGDEYIVQEWVSCGSCDYEEDVTPNREPLLHWFMFDSLAASYDLWGRKDDSWIENARRSNNSAAAELYRLGGWIV